MMRLCIADPPYPPRLATRYDVPGGRLVSRSRARRYYGDGTRAQGEHPADFHPDAGEWDDPARHARLMRQLVEEFDGWAIATTPDGIAAYGDLPVDCRLMAWVRPNAAPGGHRIRGCWEAVILYPPRPRRAGATFVSDVLIASSPRVGFAGAKPAGWTHWVLDALGYEPGDSVTDLFPGSGAVSQAIRTYAPTLDGAIL